MTNVKYIEAEEADFEQFEVKNAPVTSARTATEALIDALNDASASSTVSIHRQSGSGKENLTFLESFAPDKYDSESLLMHIRNSYGGGDYRIHVRENGKLRANRGVSIEAPISVSRETNTSTPILELLDFMQKSHNQMAQMFRENQNRHDSGDSEEKFLSKMLQYKQLFGGETQKSQGFSEILQTVAGLKELGINVGGIASEPSEDGFGKILENAAPILTALINRTQQSPQPQRQPVYKQNPQPRQQPGPIEMSLKVQLGIDTLVRAAAKGADTAFYADVVLDNVDEETLVSIFNSPNTEADLFKINPKTRDHIEWFKDLGEHLKGMLGFPSIYAGQYSELTTGEGEDITGEIPHHNV